MEKRDAAEEEAKFGFRTRITSEQEACKIYNRIRQIEDEQTDRSRRKQLLDYEYEVQQAKYQEMIHRNLVQLKNHAPGKNAVWTNLAGAITLKQSRIDYSLNGLELHGMSLEEVDK